MADSKKRRNTKGAAEFLGISAGTLEVWRSAKRYNLPYIKVGRYVQYEEEDLVRFLESRKVHPVKAR